MTTTTTPNKTQATSLISQQNVLASTQVIGSWVDVSAKLAATVWIHFGRRVVTAATAGITFRIEGSAKSAGDGFNFPLATVTTAFAVTTTQPVTSSSASGQKVVTMTTTTNFVAGDIIYIDDLNTAANSEWGRVASVSAGASITLEDNLLNTHTNTPSATNVYRAAEMYAIPVDLSAVGRLRVVSDAAIGPFNQVHAVEVLMTTLDSVSTA